MPYIANVRFNRAVAGLLLLLVTVLVAGVAPAAGDQPAAGPPEVEEFTIAPIADTENPCGSAVGEGEGFGAITTFTRTDGSTRIVTRFVGHFLVDLPGDPVPNVWDPNATTLEGTFALTSVEDSTKGFRLRLRVWGETDTGVNGRINQKIVAGPEGGYMTWNCFDGTGKHRVDF